MTNRRLFLVLISILLSALAQAQLTPEEKTAAVESLAKEMQARYVLKDKADQVAAMLRANLTAKSYDSIEKGEDLAKTLSEQCNAICKDAHLRVRYSETPFPVRKDRAEASKEEIEQQRRYTRLTNAGFEEVKRLGGNIGYIRFFNFMDPEAAKRPIRAAMAFVQDTDALIFDIRENGGGHPDTVRQLCNYLFDKPTHLNSLIFRRGNTTETRDFKTEPISDPKYLNKPIFVLVSKRTGSGAEEFAYNLQTQKRGLIIGENTWGGANPGGTVRLTDHFMAFIPDGMAKNPITGTNWEGTGVTPDVKVAPAEALKTAQIMAIQELLKTATGPDKERLSSVLKELGG